MKDEEEEEEEEKQLPPQAHWEIYNKHDTK